MPTAHFAPLPSGEVTTVVDCAQWLRAHHPTRRPFDGRRSPAAGLTTINPGRFHSLRNPDVLFVVPAGLRGVIRAHGLRAAMRMPMRRAHPVL
jgi:hypothetical protein